MKKSGRQMYIPSLEEREHRKEGQAAREARERGKILSELELTLRRRRCSNGRPNW